MAEHSAWLQSCDQSYKNILDTDYESTRKLIESFDWDRELTVLQEMEEAKKPTCLPGIGIWIGKNMFRIVCMKKNSFELVFEFMRPVKFLGFIPTKRKEFYHVDKLSMQEIIMLHQFFYEARYTEIADFLIKKTGPKEGAQKR